VLLAYLVSLDARPLSSGFHFPEWPWTTYFLTQTAVILHYARLAVSPSPLVLDYDWRPINSAADAVVPFVLLAMTFVLGSWGFVRRKSWGFAALAFFILLAPTSSVLPIVTEIAAEHRMYLPLAIIVAAALAGLNAVWLRTGRRDRAVWVMGMIMVVIGSELGVATDRRNAVYASDAGIWFDTIQKQPKNARARNYYASDLLKSGQSKAAEEHLQVAVAESPNFADAHANLGVALAAEGRTADAITHFERALAINPFYTPAYEDLAEAYDAQNQLAKAVKYFLKALDQKPDDVALLNKTAWILATAIDPAARDGKEALVLAEQAVALTSRNDAGSLDTLAAAYAETGRFDDAIAAGTEALTLARARGDQAFPAELTERLELYRAHKPVRM
jgi:tetratricopeptide (TPR) repeat protein